MNSKRRTQKSKNKKDKAKQIKVRSIKYDYDPADDNFVSGAGDKYNVARLNMEMIGNYINYDNFLKEMYKHKHFLDIQSIENICFLDLMQVLQKLVSSELLLA